MHRTRQTLIRQRTQISNAIRGHMAEFGVVAPVGREGLQRLIADLQAAAPDRATTSARTRSQIKAATTTARTSKVKI